MMIQAVIFDMDGLLMDSENLGLTAIHDCALRQGINVPVEISKQCIGITTAASSALLTSHFPSLDTARLFRDFAEYMHEKALIGQVPLKKGALSLLQYLQKKGIPAAVASSSGMQTIQLYLEKAGIAHYFQVLLSANGMPSKPAPDVFLKAAEQLGERPENCLVLEDSYNGVKAGRAAGMQVCMVPDVLPYVEKLQPFVDHVLPDLEKVMELMGA